MCNCIEYMNWRCSSFPCFVFAAKSTARLKDNSWIKKNDDEDEDVE